MNSIMAYIWLRAIFFVSLRVAKFRPCRQPYNMVFIPSVSPYVQRQYRNRSHLTRLWVNPFPNVLTFK